MIPIFWQFWSFLIGAHFEHFRRFLFRKSVHFYRFFNDFSSFYMTHFYYPDIFRKENFGKRNKTNLCNARTAEIFCWWFGKESVGLFDCRVGQWRRGHNSRDRKTWRCLFCHHFDRRGIENTVSPENFQ